MSVRDFVATPIFVLLLLPMLTMTAYSFGFVNKTIVGISLTPLVGYILLNRQQFGLVAKRRVIPWRIAEKRARKELEEEKIFVTPTINHSSISIEGNPHYVFFYSSPIIDIDEAFRVVVNKYDGNIPEKYTIETIDILYDIKTRPIEIQKTYSSASKGEITDLKNRIEQLELEKNMRTPHPKDRRVDNQRTEQEKN